LEPLIIARQLESLRVEYADLCAEVEKLTVRTTPEARFELEASVAEQRRILRTLQKSVDTIHADLLQTDVSLFGPELDDSRRLLTDQKRYRKQLETELTHLEDEAGKLRAELSSEAAVLAMLTLAADEIPKLTHQLNALRQAKSKQVVLLRAYEWEKEGSDGDSGASNRLFSACETEVVDLFGEPRGAQEDPDSTDDGD
jgi:chromosome segregation ATPase